MLVSFSTIIGHQHIFTTKFMQMVLLFDSVLVVDGNWSTWTSFSTCSQTCGDTGVQVKHRSCDNPSPSCGGALCEGNNSATVPCNRDVECPSMH